MFLLAKILEYYNHRYKGSLTDNECEVLEHIMKLSDEKGSVPSLKNIILDLTDEQVTQIKKTGKCDTQYKIGELTDMQTLGVAYMYHAKSCILADSVGLGKTVQFAGLCNLMDSIAKQEGRECHFLYLTEKNLAVQAQSELIKFTGKDVELVFGDKVKCSKFVENHYDSDMDKSVVGVHSCIKSGIFVEWLKRRVAETGCPFDVLGVDESSFLGNSKSDYWKAFNALKGYFKRIIFLNATPFESSLSVFYNQLRLLDPSFLPSKTAFDKEYVIMKWNGSYSVPSGKYKNADKFRHLIGYRYLKRTRAENGAVMQGCTGRVVITSLTKEQKALLRKTCMPQLVYDCPNMIDNSLSFDEINVPKLDALRDILSGDFKEADTVLLFIHYKESQACVSEWLTDNGYSNRVLNGETSPKNRYEIIEEFKRGAFRVLITNVQKGLNFGNCDYCIFYGFDTNPNKMVQMEGRITRSFDIIGKNVYLICSEGKEYDTYQKVVRGRAVASDAFTGSDLSCIMGLLLNGG